MLELGSGMRATLGLLAGITALAVGAGAQAQVRAQAIDSRAALFNAAFTTPRPLAAAHAPMAPISVHSTGGSIVDRAPGAHAIAFDQPGYLTAADEGALDFGAPGSRSTLSLSGGGYEFAFVPQGAVNAGDGASSAQAGAMVSVGTNIQDKVMTGLSKLGMRTVTSAALQDRNRFYLFAAYSGREVGLNFGRGAQGGVQRLGWSADGASTLVSDGQVGMGWRKGAMQASVGYVHRDVSANEAGFGSVGMQKLSDNMVAFTFSLRPR
jgi:hypothetical protein